MNYINIYIYIYRLVSGLIGSRISCFGSMAQDLGREAWDLGFGFRVRELAVLSFRKSSMPLMLILSPSHKGGELEGFSEHGWFHVL